MTNSNNTATAMWWHKVLKKTRLSVRALAKLAGISTSSVYSGLRGTRNGIETLERVANVTGMKLPLKVRAEAGQRRVRQLDIPNMKRVGSMKDGKSSYIYTAFVHMHARCSDPGRKHYGGANPPVSISPEWARTEDGFKRFTDHLGERPSPAHSIHRIDPFGNYEPANLKWATPKEQADARRNNSAVELNGGKMTLLKAFYQVAKIRGIASFRVDKNGKFRKVGCRRKKEG